MIYGHYAASGGIGLTWLEVCRHQTKVFPNAGPAHASYRQFGWWHVHLVYSSPELLWDVMLLSIFTTNMLEVKNYAFCPGIVKYYSALAHHTCMYKFSRAYTHRLHVHAAAHESCSCSVYLWWPLYMSNQIGPYTRGLDRWETPYTFLWRPAIIGAFLFHDFFANLGLMPGVSWLL